MKDNTYRNNPRNRDEPKTNIIADISLVTLQTVSANMLRRARLCMQYAGAHFQNFLYQDVL
jgi:hypothetical protein